MDIYKNSGKDRGAMCSGCTLKKSPSICASCVGNMRMDMAYAIQRKAKRRDRREKNRKYKKYYS